MKNNNLVHPIKFKSKPKAIALVLIGSILTVLSVYSGFSFRSPQERGVPKDKFGDILAITQTPTPFLTPPPSHFLPSSKWVPQTFNNCGPAAVSMLLQHFGHNVPQEETKRKLRTGDDDKNIFMYQIEDYLRSQYQIESKILINGDIATIKTLIANGIYVLVEDWLSPGEDIGHVLLITGYDDSEGVLVADDSYFGTNIKYPYETWEEEQWKPYNREFMPVYEREKENMVKSIIGENWSEKRMYENAIASSLKELDKNPNDMYALFNLGSDYFAVGEYQKAKEAFEKSQALAWPPRMLWYSIDPIKNYNKLGEYQNALNLSLKALAGNEPFAEVHYERYIAYKGLGKTDLAHAALARALALDPNLLSN